ncbi:hypothetical protein CDAR_469761 [Caerostris darwini]|uniref:Uncharacterized protein n=1 Tax=Caerostris darwini TaxID=1538125 RepID=A0AAV4TWT4_9ARAC|nr:hypothetical protein CDAR_469761 [Caerostris darwini]
MHFTDSELGSIHFAYSHTLKWKGHHTNVSENVFKKMRTESPNSLMYIKTNVNVYHPHYQCLMLFVLIELPQSARTSILEQRILLHIVVRNTRYSIRVVASAAGSSPQVYGTFYTARDHILVIFKKFVTASNIYL